jgi:hypothetical protein
MATHHDHANLPRRSSATAKLDALRSSTERTIHLLKERRSALISAAVTGTLAIPESKP